MVRIPWWQCGTLEKVPDEDLDTLQGSLTRGPTSRMPAARDPLDDEGERYAVGAQLARGGMGEIRLAHDTRIDREVAIKLMHPEQRDHATVARFFREAHIQGRLEHPSVVPVHDLGVDAFGNPYFVMKRLAGTTLAEVLAKRGTDAAVRKKWPRRQLLARLVDVCLAVEFAHTRGIVHRDLKPANIILGDFGEAYVLDWGLARVIDDLTPSRTLRVSAPEDGKTAAGTLLGTPGYMPPEQIRSPTVESSADVYALGCILYEILTGETALPSGIKAIDATLAADCHRPSVRFPEVAIPELDDVCAQATAADPKARPKARTVADAIQAYLDGDRDLARRRELARTHATRARDALLQAGDEARAIAMREAGRALVLDADNADAQGVIARLLLEAPNVLPEQARVEVNHDRAVTRQAMLSAIWRGYICIALTTLTLFLLPVRHPAMAWTLFVLTIGASATSYIAALRPLPMRHPIFLVMVGFNTLCLAAGCIILGPFLLMPVFLVGALTGSLIPAFGFRWPVIVGPQLLGYVAPLVLEWTGVLPSTYRIDSGGIVLAPWVVDLQPSMTSVLIVIATLVMTLLMTMMIMKQRGAQDVAQDRVHAHTWHLRQLVPRGTASQRRLSTGESMSRSRS